MIKNNQTVVKCCGVVYDLQDIDRIVNFCNSKNFNYYYIKHIGSNELDEEDTHKEHYHFIIESDSSHRFIINKLITDTCKNNLFQKCDNVDAYLRYMLHIDYVDKEHYEITDIISNRSRDSISDRVNNVIINTKEIDKLNFERLLELIVTGHFVSMREIVHYCLVNNIDYKTSWTVTFNSLLRSM